MAVFEWTEETPVTANNLNAMQEQNQDEVDTKLTNEISKIGKVLWEGSFTTGTLTIPHLNEYTMICIVSGTLLMLGNQKYGGLSFRTYRSATINHWGYRFTYDADNNTLTTDTDNPGASDGANQLSITKIIGVF